MKLYLVRHGESESNAGLTGHLDSRLTEKGRRQADLAAMRLSHEGINHIFVSPLRRTLETAAPICRATGVRAEIYADVCEYFSDQRYLEFPGLTVHDLRDNFPFASLGDTFPCDTAWWPRQIENATVMYERAQRVRDSLLARYRETQENVLVVSHAETVGRLIEAFQYLPPGMEAPWSENCAISCLQCGVMEGESATLLYSNDTAHLAEL